jgi:siroheme synthase-like protein
MLFFPVCLDLKNRPVLVVGGGPIAEGKLLQLVEAGAQVHLVSPAVTEVLQTLVENGAITYRCGKFEDSDLAGKFLVVCATNFQAVNEEVATAAALRNMLCNVVDQPALCNFITPAIVSRGALQISISSAGQSPSVAQRVKREIEELIGPEFETLLEITSALRADFREITPDYNTRRDFLRSFVDSEALNLIRQGKVEEAKNLAQQMLADFVKENGATK